MASILILGASYGSLLATRLALAGHDVCLVCTPPTADLVNREGTTVRFPRKGGLAPVAVHSWTLPGAVMAAAPRDVQPARFDLCVLGMQECQYSEAGVRELMLAIAGARVPCLAIMNMPPLAYLHRLGRVETASLQPAYTEPALWESFDPELVTLASPDPQAFRPAGEGKNVLQVGLPTNFKAAAFRAPAPTALLRSIASDIEASRFHVDGEDIELPVKLKVHESPYVPLAKWPMLLTGNYRCIREDGIVSIRDAVHDDLVASRELYEWVTEVCCTVGADRDDLVGFDRYAAAANTLLRPSSVARSLDAGAPSVERVDMLVQALGEQHRTRHPALDRTVARVDARLHDNRAHGCRVS